MLSEWEKALFYSFIAHATVLFPVIVADTFLNKDFELMQASVISATFGTALIIYFTLLFIVFKLKIKD